MGEGDSMKKSLEPLKEALVDFLHDPLGHFLAASVWIVVFIMGWLIFRTIATRALQIIGVI
jgi:hypothetical protein